MEILVAFEESQRVCIAFRALGHEAYSCDIKKASGGHPEWHLQGDVLCCLDYPWDMIIAFPPCTYLSKVQAHLCKNDPDRYNKMVKASQMFHLIYNLDVPHICIENPVPWSATKIPPPTQIIQPYQFGIPYTKQTCLWLKGLPLLQHTEIVHPVGSWVRHVRGSEKRSKTFITIANAMANQWSKLR